MLLWSAILRVAALSGQPRTRTQSPCLRLIRPRCGLCWVLSLVEPDRRSKSHSGLVSTYYLCSDCMPVVAVIQLQLEVGYIARWQPETTVTVTSTSQARTQPAPGDCVSIYLNSTNPGYQITLLTVCGSEI